MAKKVSIAGLVICILITEFIGGLIGSLFTLSSLTTWYAALFKPAFAPSGSVIGIIWTTLFFLMGIALYLVWERMPKSKCAIITYSVQLALNVLWSFIFFYLRSPLGGLIEIAFLWAAIFVTIVSFHRFSRTAAALLVPYILWVTIAAYLNYSIFILNH